MLKVFLSANFASVFSLLTSLKRLSSFILHDGDDATHHDEENCQFRQYCDIKQCYLSLFAFQIDDCFRFHEIDQNVETCIQPDRSLRFILEETVSDNFLYNTSD